MPNHPERTDPESRERIDAATFRRSSCTREHWGSQSHASQRACGMTVDSVMPTANVARVGPHQSPVH